MAAFEIVELFGHFNYAIPFNLEEHVTAFIAPNGTGKTLCLRLIAALFAQKWSVFREIEFSRAIYRFNDGSVIEVRKRTAAAGGEPDADTGISLSLIRPQKSRPITWIPKLNGKGKGVPQIDRYVPFLTKVGLDRFRHDHTGEVFSAFEAVDLYSEMLPEALRDVVYGGCPVEVADIIKSIDCKLIETQRLLILSDQRLEGYYGRPRPNSTLAITRKAEKLKDIISKEMNDYAALSQTLDRSFPKRVINRPMMDDPADLSRQLAELDNKRLELGRKLVFRHANLTPLAG